MIRSVFAALFYLLVAVSGASAQNCAAYPNTLTNGTNADATQVMGNFNYVLGCVRDKLVAPRTYYVRTDGSDSNTGLTNTSGGAFLTIQKAIDTVCTLDLSIYQVTIQVGNGSYTAGNLLKNYVGSLAPIIVGDTTTPSNVVINPTGSDSFLNDAALPWTVKGFQLKSTSAGSQLRGKNGGTIYFQDLDFAASAGNHIWFEGGAKAVATGNYKISGAPGGDGIHALASDAAFIKLTGVTVTVTGTPAFSAFAAAARNGVLRADSATFSGASTGARYSANLNGVIYTGGGGANFFPGNSAGSSTSGGQYN